MAFPVIDDADLQVDGLTIEFDRAQRLLKIAMFHLRSKVRYTRREYKNLSYLVLTPGSRIYKCLLRTVRINS